VQWRAVIDQLQAKFPKLTAMMIDTAVLTFLDFLKGRRARIHSTNVLERLSGEIKRRTNVAGILPNESTVRRIGALSMEQNDEYVIQHQYMSLESLATISESRTIWLPAAPALA
jgi:transposase-like protein